MEEQLIHYIGLLITIMIGIFLIKKFANCLIRVIITLIILAAIGAVYYMQTA